MRRLSRKERGSWVQRSALAFVVLILGGCASAQPRWVDRTPDGYRNNYVVGRGSGRTVDAARRGAIADGLLTLAKSGRLTLELARETDTIWVAESFGTPRAGLQRRSTSVSELAISGEATEIQGLVIAESYELPNGSGYDAAVLLRIPKLRDVRDLPTRGQLALQSLMLPGWGQNAKGEHAKGRTIMALTASLVLGAVGMHVYREDRLDAASQTGIQAVRDQRIAEANQARRFELAATYGAFGVWGYGVLDALAGPIHLYASRADGAVGVGVAIPFR